MSLTSLLYISRSVITPSDAEPALHEIVATALRRNTSRQLTGALLFTGTHFAQVLEGEASAIDDLMFHIRADSRHDALMIVDRRGIHQRRFADWSMAYFGPSQFVSRHVTRLLNDQTAAHQSRAAEWLTELLCEFSSAESLEVGDSAFPLTVEKR